MPSLATLVNRLIAEGTVERVRVNRYRINPTVRTRQLHYSPSVGSLFTLTQIHAAFTQAQPGWQDDFMFRLEGNPDMHMYVGARPEPVRSQAAPEEPPVLRTITRQGYHTNGNGTSRNGAREALATIPADEDGVVRSYGLEWEIYSLSPQQEDRLARLLDTLPAHFTERDGSLGSSGVEIIFLPLGEQEYKRVWNALKAFCVDNGVSMSGTGAHTTFGVSNTEITDVSDLQIRINRVALAIKAASTQRAIKTIFGRDFTGYAELPRSTTHSSHSNAWSASRGTSAYELRLCSWEGDVDKIVAIMKATEFVFHRTFNAQDFINIFSIMGSDCMGN